MASIDWTEENYVPRPPETTEQKAERLRRHKELQAARTAERQQREAEKAETGTKEAARDIASSRTAKPAEEDDGGLWGSDGRVGGPGFDPELSDDLIKGVLPEEGVLLVTGVSGAMKTFGLLRLCKDLATMKTFCGFPIMRHGGTVYLGYESPATIKPRIEAMRVADDDGDEEIAFMAPTDLRPFSEDRAFERLETSLERAHDRFIARFRIPLVFVLIDTAIAAGLIADEMKPEQWQAMWNRLAGIARRLRIVIGVVAHAGKDASQGARGSSANYAGADAELTFSAAKNRITGDIVGRLLALTKSKDGTTFPMAALTGDEWFVGKTPKGERKNVFAVEFDTSPEAIERAIAQQAEAVAAKPARAETGAGNGDEESGGRGRKINLDTHAGQIFLAFRKYGKEVTAEDGARVWRLPADGPQGLTKVMRQLPYYLENSTRLSNFDRAEKALKKMTGKRVHLDEVSNHYFVSAEELKSALGMV